MLNRFRSASIKSLQEPVKQILQKIIEFFDCH